MANFIVEKRKAKRFWLFVWFGFQPSGGMSDFVEDFGSLAGACEAGWDEDHELADYGYVVDTATGLCYDRDGVECVI